MTSESSTDTQGDVSLKYVLAVINRQNESFAEFQCKVSTELSSIKQEHAGHTRKASRISKAVVDNCGKGVDNFYLS